LGRSKGEVTVWVSDHRGIEEIRWESRLFGPRTKSGGGNRGEGFFPEEGVLGELRDGERAGKSSVGGGDDATGEDTIGPEGGAWVGSSIHSGERIFWLWWSSRFRPASEEGTDDPETLGQGVP